MLVAMNAQFYPILLSWCPSRSVLARNLEKIVEGLIHLDRRSETPFDPAVFLYSRKRDRCFVQRQKAQGFFLDRSLYDSKTDHDDDELGGDVTSHHGGISDALFCKRHYITVNGFVFYVESDFDLVNRFCFQCHPFAFPMYILCGTSRINANEPN